MATGVTTLTQIDKAIRTYVAKALIVREHEGVMDKLTDVKTLPRNQGLTYHEPLFNALTSAALTDGVELDSPQQLLDEEITVQPTQYGAQVLITKWTNDLVSENLFSLAGTAMSRANEYSRDRTGLTQLDSFGASFGSGTATLVPGHISSATSMLRSGRAASGGTLRTGARTTGDPAPPPYYCVIHEFQLYDLAALQSGNYFNDTTQGTTDPTMAFAVSRGSISEYQRKWIEEHYMGQFRGTKVMTDNNLTIASNAAKGAVFAKEAIIHLKFTGLNKKNVETDDGRAEKMTLTDAWGWGERADTWGIELNVAAIAPTT